MIVLGMLIIMLCLVVDLATQIAWGPLVLKSQLVSLFLFFLLFRRKLSYILLLFVFYLVMVITFTQVPIIPLFLSYFVVLVVIYHLRKQIYTESYLVKSIWVFISGFLQQVILSLMVVPNWNIFGTSILLVNLLVNSLLLMLITIPFFMTWDKWFDYFESHLESRRVRQL